jgi:short-subunit dehydrogenase involved in D-alanine esterification of teichoic acids
MSFELDANDESADRETVELVVEMFGRLDVVVNNAGNDSPGSLEAREGSRCTADEQPYA